MGATIRTKQLKTSELHKNAFRRPGCYTRIETQARLKKLECDEVLRLERMTQQEATSKVVAGSSWKETVLDPADSQVPGT